jgi:hypothetical protein
MKYLLYFASGFIINALATLDMIFVQGRQAWGSGITTMFIMLINCTVIITLAHSKKNKLETLSYILGGGIGAGLTVWVL